MKERCGKIVHIRNSDTHQEFLKEAIMSTEGDILEMGCSHGSTGFILDLIKGTDRVLHSLTIIGKDYKDISTYYPTSENHKWYYYKDYEFIIDTMGDRHFGVVFIDSMPWNSRKIGLVKLYKKCDFMLIHDADLLIQGKLIQPDKYFTDLTMCRPYPEPNNFKSATLICKNSK